MLTGAALTPRSSENPIPTETFLLPGQQFCIGMPWDRAGLPKHGLPAPLPRPPASGTTLDEPEPGADPCAGWEIGACQIIRRLSPGPARDLLALRDDPDEGEALVVLRRIDLPDVLARDVKTHADWAAQYRHPHLTRVYGCEVADEGIFWVTELSSGASLAEISAACREKGRGVPLGLALSSVYEAALGLGEIHGTPGFAHGLVSDQSVAVGFDGTAKLQGVGLFRCIARRTSWAEVLEPMGPYLAPEQILQGHLPDPKCDVYSLGIVLYECLSGEKVRRASNFDDRVKMHLNGVYVPPSSFNVALGRQLDDVVFKALTHDRSKRYATAAEFARALKKAAAGFMWKKEQRAQFVGGLFPTRKRREEVLLAGCSPARLPRRTTSPAVRAVESPAPALEAPPAVAVAALPEVPAPQPAPAIATAPRRRSNVRVLLLALAASLAAWVAQSGALPGLLSRQEPQFDPPPPPPPAQVAPEVVANVPAPAEDPAGLVCVSEPPAPEAAKESVSAAPEKPAPKAKIRALNRKRHRDEIPVAPWLAPHPARGKRGR